MNISLTQPLSRAFARMKRILFRPFHLETWLVIGFAAFLAGIFSGSGSGSSWRWNGRGKSATHEIEHGVERVRDVIATLNDHPIILVMIVAGLCVVGLLLLVLAWVSARSEFVFLDNVSTGRAAFLDPWRRFGKLGRSLFLWRAVFSFAWLPPLAIILLPFVGVIATALKGGSFEWPQFASLVFGFVLGGVLSLVLMWICMLMDDFVVPLMYRHDENATQAWSRFLGLLGRHPGEFLAYTVFLAVLYIAVGVGIVVVGLGTCCITFVLMIVPYVGSVVTLPIHVTARALGPEVLAQFGPEWTTLAPLATEEEDAPLPDAPPTPPIV